MDIILGLGYAGTELVSVFVKAVDSCERPIDSFKKFHKSLITAPSYMTSMGMV